MRAHEFLLEYKRDITKQKLGDKLLLAAKKDRNQNIDVVLSTLEQIDPTRNKQYTEWLCKQYINNQFRLEDANRVSDVLQKFESIKSRLQQKDINRYTFYSLDELMDKEYNVNLNTDTNKDNKDNKDTNKDTNTDTFPVVPNSKVLYSGPLGQLAIPETEEASCELGRGTKWCTAARENNMYDQYSAVSPLYVWRDKNGKKYQFFFGDFDEMQFMDNKDHPIDDNTLNYFRTHHPVLSKLFKQE